jgi:UPF0755 protein
MIEKEVLHDDERPRVASVIYNRLRRNMPLQIDATVLYGMGLWKERVLYKDLRHESPYNTYLRRGLPLGPIASPGLASIRAALEPEQTEYLFLCGAGERLPPLLAHLRGTPASAIREIRQTKSGE